MIGRIEQDSADCRCEGTGEINALDGESVPCPDCVGRELTQTVMTLNTRIRELENENVFLRKQYGEALDQLADAGMEIKRLREAVREARREVFARIREKGYVVVPREPTDKMFDDGHEALVETHQVGQYGECPGLGWANSGACYRAMTSAIDQDAVEREVMG